MHTGEFEDYDEYEAELKERLQQFDYGNQKKADSTRLYQILGINRSTSCEEVPLIFDTVLKQRRAYLNELQRFEIIFAANVLSDPDRRRIYERLGEAALDNYKRELYKQTNRDSEGGDKGKKVENTEIVLDVTLSEVFTGMEKELEGTRKRPCKRCTGTGSMRLMPCSNCKGQGKFKDVNVQGYFEEVSCEKCNGIGSVGEPNSICTACNGEKVTEEKFPILLELAKGSPNNSQYRYKGEGNQYPGYLPGDIVVKIKYKLPPGVRVKDGDIIITRELTLAQSIIGYRIPYEHLDGTKHILISPPGEITPPDSNRSFRDLGMPIYNRPGNIGSLIIEFKTIPSPPLSPYLMQTLRDLLPGGEVHNPDDFPRGEKHTLIDFSESQVSKELGEAYSDHKGQDQDEEERRRREGRPECSGTIF